MAAMTDPEAQAIHLAVRRFCERRSGSIDFTAEWFDWVVASVPPAPTAARDDVRAVCALAWIGPDEAGPPPPLHRTRLLRLLGELLPDPDERRERAYEFAVAYGCGKWRVVDGNSGDPWDGRWPEAIRALARAGAPAVGECSRWLSGLFTGWVAGDFQTWWGVSTLLAYPYILPEHRLRSVETLTVTCEPGAVRLDEPALGYSSRFPAGARAVWSVVCGDARLTWSDGTIVVLSPSTRIVARAGDDDAVVTALPLSGRRSKRTVEPGETLHVGGADVEVAVWECTCGTDRCEERHRLESWDPTAVVFRNVESGGARERQPVALTLWSHFANAIKGPEATLRPGSFVAGMYAAYLTATDNLRTAPTALKVCANCETEYQGARCSVCHDGRVERVLCRDRLVWQGNGRYQQEYRLRCRNRQAHFEKLQPGRLPGKLGEEWDILSEIPVAWGRADARWSNVQRARHLLRHRRLLAGVVGSIQTRDAKGCVPWKDFVSVTEGRQVTAGSTPRAAPPSAVVKALADEIQRQFGTLTCHVCGRKAAQRPTAVWVR